MVGALLVWWVTFTQLLLVRVGVAVGEAGCVPPAQSLIADHFDRAERPSGYGDLLVVWSSFSCSCWLSLVAVG